MYSASGEEDQEETTAQRQKKRQGPYLTGALTGRRVGFSA
jgi:hypothetical protein